MNQFGSKSDRRGRRAIVLDDHQLFGESFSHLLQSTGFFSNVISFFELDAYYDYLINVRTNEETYLFLDFYLGSQTILPVINESRRYQKNPKVVIVTSASNPMVIKSLLTAKADAILNKSCSLSDVLDCLPKLSQGKQYYGEAIAAIIESDDFEADDRLLTSRELEILAVFAKGHTLEEVAQQMQLSPHTIAAHRRKMFVKTKSRNIVDLLNYARKVELL